MYIHYQRVLSFCFISANNIYKFLLIPTAQATATSNKAIGKHRRKSSSTYRVVWWCAFESIVILAEAQRILRTRSKSIDRTIIKKQTHNE